MVTTGSAPSYMSSSSSWLGGTQSAANFCAFNWIAPAPQPLSPRLLGINEDAELAAPVPFKHPFHGFLTTSSLLAACTGEWGPAGVKIADRKQEPSCTAKKFPVAQPPCPQSTRSSPSYAVSVCRQPLPKRTRHQHPSLGAICIKKAAAPKRWFPSANLPTNETNIHGT